MIEDTLIHQAIIGGFGLAKVEAATVAWRIWHLERKETACTLLIPIARPPETARGIKSFAMIKTSSLLPRISLLMLTFRRPSDVDMT